MDMMRPMTMMIQTPKLVLITINYGRILKSWLIRIIWKYQYYHTFSYIIKTKYMKWNVGNTKLYQLRSGRCGKQGKIEVLGSMDFYNVSLHGDCKGKMGKIFLPSGSGEGIYFNMMRFWKSCSYV
jgi:hypothetical protein